MDENTYPRTADYWTGYLAAELRCLLKMRDDEVNPDLKDGIRRTLALYDTWRERELERLAGVMPEDR